MKNMVKGPSKKGVACMISIIKSATNPWIQQSANTLEEPGGSGPCNIIKVAKYQNRFFFRLNFPANQK